MVWRPKSRPIPNVGISPCLPLHLPLTLYPFLISTRHKFYYAFKHQNKRLIRDRMPENKILFGRSIIWVGFRRNDSARRESKKIVNAKQVGYVCCPTRKNGAICVCNPLKCSGIRWLRLKLFNATQSKNSF